MQADTIDLCTLYPETRRKVVRLLAEIEAAGTSERVRRSVDRVEQLWTRPEPEPVDGIELRAAAGAGSAQHPVAAPIWWR